MSWLRGSCLFLLRTFFIVSALSGWSVVQTHSAQASECVGTICVGKWVHETTHYGTFGIVETIRGALATIRTTNRTVELPVTSLKSEVAEHGEVTRGEKLLRTDKNEVSTVQVVFEDGYILVPETLNGKPNPKKLPPDMYVAEVSEVNGVRKGLLVVDSQSRVGRAESVFANGTVEYRYREKSLIQKGVVAEVDSLNGLVRGEKVMVSDYWEITQVVALFPDGRVVLGYAPDKLVPIERIQRSVENYGSFSKGDRVITRVKHLTQNVVGNVSKIFQHGWAEVTVDPRFQGVTHKPNLLVSNVTEQLSLKVPQWNGLIEGKLFLSGRFARRAIEVFSGGQVLGSDGRDLYVFDKSENIASVTELDGFKADDLVAYDNAPKSTWSGWITAVFANGEAVVAPEKFTELNPERDFSRTVPLRELLHEVPSHPLYEKGQYYSTPDFKVGTAEHFFEKGYGRLGTAFSPPPLVPELVDAHRQFFPVVSYFNGVGAGDSVVGPANKTAVLEMIFENGAVLFRLPGVSEVKSARLFQFSDESRKQADLATWLRGTAAIMEAKYFPVDGYGDPNAVWILAPSSQISEIKREALIFWENHPKKVSINSRVAPFVAAYLQEGT